MVCLGLWSLSPFLSLAADAPGTDGPSGAGKRQHFQELICVALSLNEKPDIKIILEKDLFFFFFPPLNL